MGKLTRGIDGGGERFFLDGRPVHAGTGLEVRLPGDVWVGCRFETSDRRPALYVPMGGAWETWTPPAGHREGDDIQAACDDCASSGRRHPGETCERCEGRGSLQGLNVRDRSLSVSCDVAHHGRRVGGDLIDDGPPECDAGKVTRERACSTCDGKGHRRIEVQRPSAPTVVIRGDYSDPDLARVELRWPVRSA